jgi:hypothetical protein
MKLLIINSYWYMRKSRKLKTLTATRTDTFFTIFDHVNLPGFFQVTISKDKTVFKYGKDITLTCQVKGYPIPVIRWYKNNTPVPKSSRLVQ